MTLALIFDLGSRIIVSTEYLILYLVEIPNSKCGRIPGRRNVTCRLCGTVTLTFDFVSRSGSCLVYISYIILFR